VTKGTKKEGSLSVGRVIENPVTGERLTFLVTAEETGGELLRVKTELPAGSPGVPMHYHLAFTERFEVLDGRLDMCVGSKRNRIVLTAGESVFAPIRTYHRFWNGGDEPVVFVGEIRPARRMERSLRVAHGLARDGRTSKKGVPTNPFELALLYELSESYIAGMPLFLQKGVFGALAKVARWRGYDPEFTRYTRPESA
jgi:mannose-6-phosphate isomerase-like protein (cupin superfamily)